MAIVCVLGAVASPAAALQPLERFVVAAASYAPDNREAQAIARQRGAELDQSWGRLLPAFTGQGRYRLNQYEVSFPIDPTTAAGAPGGAEENVVILPKNEWAATLTLEAPLINVGGWLRVGAARHVARAARVQTRATDLDVQAEVARRYYRLLAARALIEAVERSLEAARENLRVAEVREAAGAVRMLDVQRARAEVERVTQDLAEAVGLEAIAQQALFSLTGLRPEPGWHRPREWSERLAPLASWLAAASGHPQTRAAQHETRAAEALEAAAWADLAPTLNAVAIEQLSNATSFVGQPAVWAIGFNLNVAFDMSMIGAARAQRHAAAATRARRDAVRQQVVDGVHDAWQRVQTQAAKRASAQAQLDAADEAVRLARISVRAGVSSQLELIEAERDALQAAASLIETEANLALAHTELRLASGYRLGAPERAGPR